jgi:hypothetical protein
LFEVTVPAFCWELKTPIEGAEGPPARSCGSTRNLQREFLETAVAQAANSTRAIPSDNQGIADALQTMLEEIRVAENPLPTSRSFVCESPEAESFVKAVSMRTAPSLDFYYKRLEAYKSDLATNERRGKEHRDKVTEAMDLLPSALSMSVRKTLKTPLATRRLDLILSTLRSKCGPRCGSEGVGELNEAWATMDVGPSESMVDFLQRLEDSADKFMAYRACWHKSGEQKVVAIRKALKSDSKNWFDWRREVREAEKEGSTWEELKTRLKKLDGELRADSAAAKDAAPKRGEKIAAAKALAAEQEKQAEGDAPKAGRAPWRQKFADETSEEKAERVAKVIWNLCAELGHYARKCPWVKDFRKLKAQVVEAKDKAALSGKASGKATPKETAGDKPKAKPAQSALAAAAEEPSSSDEDGEVGCAASAPDSSGDAQPFEDWLASAQRESTAVAFAHAEPGEAEGDWLEAAQAARPLASEH